MPTPSVDTPSTGGSDTQEKSKVEDRSEEIKVKQFAKRSKSLGTLSDSKSLLPPHQRLSRRKTEVGLGGGIRVVWRTSPTDELENLSRILGIPFRNRSVSPMKRPEPVDYVFSEYYDPLAFHARLPTNPQEATTTNSNNPTDKRRNTLKKDSVTMPSVKKLLSIFERSVPTPENTRNQNLDSNMVPISIKEHHIKFPKADKSTRLNQSVSGIANELYGQYKSKDYSEIYEDNVAVAQKPNIGLLETYSLPDHEIETRPQGENNNSSNLNNLNDFNHTIDTIHSNERPSRKEYAQIYSEANKVAKPTTSVSLLKQKWESFVKERTKPKKVSTPVNVNANLDLNVDLAKHPEESRMPDDALDTEFRRHHSDTFRKTAPFERNTTSRRSVKNIAKKYESMRESSTQAKETTEEKSQIAQEGRKKIPITHSKSFDNLRLLEKQRDPCIVDIKIQDKESLEVRKDVTVSKIDASESLSLERKPSVRDLKKKFEVIQNNEQPIVSRSQAKKSELVGGFSPVNPHVAETHDLISGRKEPKIQPEKDTLQLNGDKTTEYTLHHKAPDNKQVLTDNFVQLLDVNTYSEQDLVTKGPDISSNENIPRYDGIKIKSNESKSAMGPKTVTKKSSIKIELSLSPPNPQRKTNLSVMPTSVFISDANQASTINANLSHPDNTGAETKPKNLSGTKEKSIEKNISNKEKHDFNLVESKQIVKENVHVTLREEADSTLIPDTKLLQSMEIGSVNDKYATKLSANAIPTLNSDSKAAPVKTVLITELRSPALKNAVTPNFAEEGKRKKAKLTQMKSEDLAEKLDQRKIKGQTSRSSRKEPTTDMTDIFNQSEDNEDNQSNEQIKVNIKILERDLKVTTINTEDTVKTFPSEHTNETGRSKNGNSKVNENSDSKSMVDSKLYNLSMNSGLVDEHPSLKLTTSRLPSIPKPDNSTEILTGNEAKTNVIETFDEHRQQEQTQLNSSRKQLPIPSERTEYLSSQENSPNGSLYTIYNFTKLTADVKDDEQVVNSHRDPITASINNEKENVVADTTRHSTELNGTNSEESFDKDPQKGGPKFRGRKAARRAYTDSLLKHLIKSEASPSKQEVPKEPEIAHPNELYNLLYRKPFQDPTREVQSADAAVNKSVPPFLGRKTRSKSATSISIFNKVRELKPDELIFFKELTPSAKSIYPSNSDVTKDRASSVATSNPTFEGQSSLGKKNSFERSSLRDSQKYRKLHSDEMKFFGLNHTHN